MSKLLLNEHPLQVLPSLAIAIGLNEAIILQQLHYWLLKSKNEREGKRWVYNCYKDWQQQFPFWSERTIKRIFRNLEKKKLVISYQWEKSEYDRRKWYTINYDVLIEFENYLPTRSVQLGVSEIKQASKGTTCPLRKGQPGAVQGDSHALSNSSYRPYQSSQLDPISKTETSSETYIQTHTHKVTGQTPTASVRGSRFTLAECFKFAESKKAEGITNPGGYATVIFRTGEADSLIEAFLSLPSTIQSIDSTQCPDCKGMGFYYPNDFERGVAKCIHLRLRGTIES